ncbi:hypothetical protein [Halorubrum sp. DM2]|uniref:hypothetical protein n=1 Tax=Halorubrum sp. DM2 TaxID=2527867 RepID=UPI0024B822DE|nr:hypothetical protein [Halorubrum sp. DM2]
MNRRNVLQFFGVSSAAALAGCGDSSTVDNESSNGDSESSNVASERIVIRDIEWDWGDDGLDQVTIVVVNKGEYPVQLERAEFTLESPDTDLSRSLNTTLSPGTADKIAISSSQSIKVENLGTQIGTATVETDIGTVSESFPYDPGLPALLTFVSLRPSWDGNTITDATFRVGNLGELLTSVQISATANGEEVATAPTEKIYPGTGRSLVVSDPESLQTATSGEDAELEFTADSPAGQAAGIISQQITDTDLSVDSMSSGWANGQFVELLATLSVNADTDLSPSAQITIDDNKIKNGSFTIQANERLEDLPFYDEASSLGRQAIEPDPYEIRTGGTHEVVLNLELEDGSISASHSKEFDGLDTVFSDIEASFSSPGNGTDDVELSEVKFGVRNDGDVVLRYDSIEIGIGDPSRTDELTSSKGLLPGSSEQEHVRLSNGIAVSPGEKELTISLLYKGDEIERTTTTVTA